MPILCSAAALLLAITITLTVVDRETTAPRSFETASQSYDTSEPLEVAFEEELSAYSDQSELWTALVFEGTER